MKIRSVGGISALLYGSIAFTISAVFFIITLLGDYTWVARIGGTAWILLLSLIILMPLVTSQVKKRYRG